MALLVLQTAGGFTWTSPENVTGYVRAALPDTPAALPTERNSHAAVAIDSDLLILGGESNADLVHEMCMIDTEQQVNLKSLYMAVPQFQSLPCPKHSEVSIADDLMPAFSMSIAVGVRSFLPVCCLAFTCAVLSHLADLTPRVTWPGWSQS